jgi:hypothetical protein
MTKLLSNAITCRGNIPTKKKKVTVEFSFLEFKARPHSAFSSAKVMCYNNTQFEKLQLDYSIKQKRRRRRRTKMKWSWLNKYNFLEVNGLIARYDIFSSP